MALISRRGGWPSLLCALSLAALVGCVPVRSVVHDGLETRVVAVASGQPLAGAFVYDRLEDGQPRILARSDGSGQLQLAPQTRLLLLAPLSEAQVMQSLWVCKAGYQPQRVGGRGGWNADLSPARTFRPGSIALEPSARSDVSSCAVLPW